MNATAGHLSAGWGWLALPVLFLALWPALPSQSSAHPALERDRPQTRMRAPTQFSAHRPPLGVMPPKTYLPARAQESSGVGNSVFSGLLAFYRNVISPVDGDRCVMAPTCSLYSHQALREHGVVLGMILTADRLLHEADEIPLVPTLKENGETLYYDPLWANTFWLWEWVK